MDDEYARNTEEVMAYLAQKAMSEWTIRQHRECYASLAEHLRERGMGYSEDAAREWFEGLSPGLDRTRRSSYAGALAKLGDMYATGEIRSFHYRAPKKEDRLSVQHRQVVDGYCAYHEDSGLAPATVANHRGASIRFLLDLQDHGVEFVADASYADLLRVLRACEEEMTYYAKTGYRGKIRSLLGYLHSVGLVRYGFTLLVDAMTLKKGYCWNGVDPETVAHLRGSQADGAEGIAPEDYLAIVDALAAELVEHGYSHTAIRSASHFGNLLYLFMDVNGLRYEPRVGSAWLESMEEPLSGGDFSTCRRTVTLIAQSYGGVAHDLGKAVVARETLRDRLPGWCAPRVDAFLAVKEAEGWKRSTLVMFRTCVCRFCMFLDSVGVTDFAGVTAGHVKLFNVEDPHATPEGKNAFNSRIRQFLEWLGCGGELSNPNLFLALPNVAAPKEEAVVTLTPDEQGELEGVLAGGGDASLRDRAMLHLGLHMGIRASDVVGLQFGDITWEDATVRFEQSKAGYEVGLPMPADVANAVYRYIAHERPESAEGSVFLRCKAPYTPLAAGAAQRSLRKALPGRQVPGSGFHSLRKTFASNMLRGGAEPMQVAEALGHRGVDNVRKYLSLDEERMRLCAMSLEESGLVLEGGFADER